MAFFVACAPPPAKAGVCLEGVPSAPAFAPGSPRRCRGNPSPALPCLRRGGSRTKSRSAFPARGEGGSRGRPAAKGRHGRCVRASGVLRRVGVTRGQVAAEAAPTREPRALLHCDLRFGWGRGGEWEGGVVGEGGKMRGE